MKRLCLGRLDGSMGQGWAVGLWQWLSPGQEWGLDPGLIRVFPRAVPTISAPLHFSFGQDQRQPEAFSSLLLCFLSSLTILSLPHSCLDFAQSFWPTWYVKAKVQQWKNLPSLPPLCSETKFKHQPMQSPLTTFYKNTNTDPSWGHSTWAHWREIHRPPCSEITDNNWNCHEPKQRVLADKFLEKLISRAN